MTTEPLNPRAEDDPASAKLARVVAARAPRTRDLSIAHAVQGLAGAVRGADAGLAAASRAWASVVPPALAGACVLEALSRGVLRVRVTDAGARFELDRFLRAGGEAKVIAASSVAMRSVRLHA